ncbi:arsenical-resistance protein [Wallemia mellicola]|uniref:Arsenical-resistance protein n=1 Tax=Wallemia mellicola TaxID=1708541 RepID=A0A4T0PI79_9BASI|nr:arsenical-resistance protein [Wallemia mellicola]TIB91055.1 arsenical-resistance protein [Wallemia mellicola]TIB98965.1 arsenical-resistance protein [Wallemia mellicola]TIC04119.1 arsenical-resistance protein [Wallemia mellicola]TIC10426.1 arsenical-resistance protein [Wallemia mellicola]
MATIQSCKATSCCSTNTPKACNQEDEKAGLSDCPLFEDDCLDCDFCDGLNNFDEKANNTCATGGFICTSYQTIHNFCPSDPFKSLSIFDKLLGPLVLIAMILGVVIGVYAKDGVKTHLIESAQWEGVSVPILVGLLLMIWPALSKVNWEKLVDLSRELKLWIHVGMSIIINWIISPLMMLGIAWATLPDAEMERYRKGVLLVGVSRCIAMVIIWTTIADGDVNYCGYLMVINSLLQIVLFSPYSLLFVNILGGNSGGPQLHLDYESTARSVGIYLGIPLAAGIITRFALLKYSSVKFRGWFYEVAGKIGLIGLLYTIIVLFASQGSNITKNIGKVFRTIVPLLLYFIIVWFATFLGFWKLDRSHRYRDLAGGGYERAVTQAFTAGSNNFELAIAVATAAFGPDSPETIAATLGPLIEVPVLLLLSYVALFLRAKLFKGSSSIKLEAA